MQRGTRKFAIALGLAVSGFVCEASAQLPPPPPPPATLWSFLGVPQGYRRIKDGLSNRNGNRPNAERQPPLKAIADPANLKSPNPAIKKAAEIKMEEDLKKQKIKAIKYLASIGCGCYNRDGSITDALLKAMDDCTEEVRLATVQSISLAAAGEMCANCKQQSCCSEELSNKLYEIAYERDENGCYLEPSERVRLAAAEALRVCCPGGGEDMIFETGPIQNFQQNQGGVEQPSVLPEAGVEQPGTPLPPIVPAPRPAIPGRPGPNIPPGALPTDPAPAIAPPPAPIPAPVPVPIGPPAAEASPAPRSSRRTAMLNAANEKQVAQNVETPRVTPLSPTSEAPHWSPEQTASGKPAAAVVLRIPALEQKPSGVEATTASLSRLPPVEGNGTSEVAPPPLPATPVSSHRESNSRPNQAVPRSESKERPGQPTRLLRSGGERKIPGQEFGVGRVTKIRMKDGLAIIEFSGETSVPAGSIVRAYHEYALTGKSAVCDLEIVDGQVGNAIAVARHGSELGSLTVGDHAIVLQ